MEEYQPPFTINSQMLSQCAEISEKVGQINSYCSFESMPYLRHNNRIRSIHASLAIEANSLSPDDVRSVIGGKTVIGPQKEIQEVKNAYEAYKMLGMIDPYSLDNLKKVHGIMTFLTVDGSGRFRNHEEGVFHDDVCIFIAPPYRLVPDHMQNLFEWMKRVRNDLHPLILSSVFHYEFVFIHPFSDGNGRMARLWQTALLSEWKPVFQFLPLESCIRDFQNEYYDAIASCHAAGNSDLFICFMLDMIDRTLDLALKQVSDQPYPSGAVKKLLGVMEYDTPYTAEELLTALGLRSRENLRKLYLKPALENGLIRLSIPDKPTSRNQSYIKT